MNYNKSYAIIGSRTNINPSNPKNPINQINHSPIFAAVKHTISVKVIDRVGKEHIIEAPTDMNLNMMELCRMNGLGVEGTCGGMALCASCQVYVESAHRLHGPSDAELDMLDQAFHVRPNSRLGCQIRISEAIDGLVVRVAPK